MCKKEKLFIAANLIFLLIITPCFADHDHHQNRGTGEESIFVLPIQWFRNYLSGADGDRCPMHPSCSTYSMEAFKKHGLVIGWIMASDRLIRCGRDETSLGPSVIVRGKKRTVDPLSNNDFWWDRSGKP